MGLSPEQNMVTFDADPDKGTDFFLSFCVMLQDSNVGVHSAGKNSGILVNRVGN